ncbi:hypothetical protein H310_13875 [Aphanomyces invadans]|uniref:Glycosyl transferase family 1 domain-containing protein n=1 Tax=Aphanomyces invadans TaxID=157072 RepID=A0A024TBT3_9STRA|nr:hypothetical protein H310_13875 [Aphanomyces invadans]ETV91625.1 hypothetical protein H310_13875 [Aphanomyces invadans]|eukprot:XP_008879744.1 hypothetical protein H310_13875 [Aphanomyces invadans]
MAATSAHTHGGSARCLRPRWAILMCMGVLVAVQVLVTVVGLSHGGYMFRRTIDTNAELEADLLHLNYLNDLCLHENNSIIPWTYNNPKEVRTAHLLSKDAPLADLLAELSRCPEVDILLPDHLHGHGYCEDAMVYVKFLHTRSLPLWVFDLELTLDGRRKTYFDLCPDSAILFLNHFWEGLPTRPTFPENRTILLMPNVEMYELTREHYHQVDVVLAKTQDAYDRITSWYAREGNPRHARVWLTQHTSSDPTALARAQAKTSPSTFGSIAPKNFDTLRIFHANGHSWQKNTPKILDCWNERPDLPMLHVYSKDELSNQTYWTHFGSKQPENLEYHLGEDIDPAEFGKLMAEASVILCPSTMEGFGHYINQARAAGALVLTTNASPMNEFVDATSGILIEASERPTNGKVLMGNGTEWNIEPRAICAGMDEILAMTPRERQSMAEEGRRRYFDQLRFFRTQMNDLREWLRRRRHSHHPQN